MQFQDLKIQLKSFKIFSILDIEKIDSSFHKQRLIEWQKKGLLKKIRQGFYIFSDLPINDQVLYTIANKIYQPSYISLEVVLSMYEIIPEAVYSVTSITSRNTRSIETPVGNFIYKHVKPHLLFGYTIHLNDGHPYAVAELEKAMLDYLYLHPNLDSEEAFSEMRFNCSELQEKIDRTKFVRYADAFNSKALTKRVKKFLHYLDTQS